MYYMFFQYMCVYISSCNLNYILWAYMAWHWVNTWVLMGHHKHLNTRSKKITLMFGSWTNSCCWWNPKQTPNENHPAKRTTTWWSLHCRRIQLHIYLVGKRQLNFYREQKTALLLATQICSFDREDCKRNVEMLACPPSLMVGEPQGFLCLSNLEQWKSVASICWLVVKPPLWKIWKSIGMIIPNIYIYIYIYGIENKKWQPNHQPDMKWFPLANII